MSFGKPAKTKTSCQGTIVQIGIAKWKVIERMVKQCLDPNMAVTQPGEHGKIRFGLILPADIARQSLPGRTIGIAGSVYTYQIGLHLSPSTYRAYSVPHVFSPIIQPKISYFFI